MQMFSCCKHHASGQGPSAQPYCCSSESALAVLTLSLSSLPTRGCLKSQDEQSPVSLTEGWMCQ
jgi:hypothetical protein